MNKLAQIEKCCSKRIACTLLKCKNEDWACEKATAVDEWRIALLQFFTCGPDKWRNHVYREYIWSYALLLKLDWKSPTWICAQGSESSGSRNITCFRLKITVQVSIHMSECRRLDTSTWGKMKSEQQRSDMTLKLKLKQQNLTYVRLLFN